MNSDHEPRFAPTFPKQTRTCDYCEGYKRVAIITKGSSLLGDLLDKPLPMTFAKARELLLAYRGKGAVTMLVRQLATNLDTHPCPWCVGTGISFTLQQLTPEEAAVFREKEKKS